MRPSIYFCTLWFALLSACGGGSSNSIAPSAASSSSMPALSSSSQSSSMQSSSVQLSSVQSSNSSSSMATLTGTLTGAIKGLKYKTATQTGETNTKGEFSYLEGETISFSIGDIKLPTITAQQVVSAYTLASNDALDSTVALNITRLLQTLDQDGKYDNGIDIATMVHTIATGMTVDFSSARFVEDIANLVSNSGAINTVLISAEMAQNNLLTSLSGCTKNHSTIGQIATLSTRAHGVTGKATIINDCTIKITNFSFDGGGLDVLFYGGINGNYKAGIPLGEQLVGKKFNQATYLISLRKGDLDKLNSLSVWCVDVDVSFGDGNFITL
jgi:Electron transfer DM13